MALFTAIASAIGAVSAWIGTLGVVGSFLLRTAVGIGLNLLAQAIAGKPKDPTFAINGTLQSGGDIPRSFIVGRYMTAGSLVWVNTWGNVDDTPNAFLTQVIALSDLPVTGLAELWVAGEKVTIDLEDVGPRGYAVTEYRKDGKNNLWIKFYDGTQTAADSFLTTYASNGQRAWESTRVGYGVAYAILTSKVTKNMFSGIPSFKFVIDGTRLYDISKDSTAGGDGGQVWSDPETWGGDGDLLPAVQTYNLLRGIRYDGNWFYGLQGMAAARLPADNWIAQIGKCRAAIAGAGGAEPTYRSGGEIVVSAQIAAAIEQLMTACQGRLPEVGGVYRMSLGAPDEPTFFFDDGDIISTKEQSFTPFFGLSETINGIAASYPSPEDGWETKPAPPIYRADLEAQHGNRRLMADVDLNFVPYPEQVQRLMQSALQEGQRARRHTIVLPPEYWAYAVPGEFCSWTSARNGYEAKSFRVDGVIDLANLDVMVDITEVDPSDYDWDSGADYQPPVDGAVGPIRPQPQPIIDWFAEASSVKDDEGVARRPAILLTWDHSEGRLDDVVATEFEVRLEASLETIYVGRTEQPEIGSLLISQGLLPATTYEVRGRYIPGSDRPAIWSDWLEVTTLDIRITDVLVNLEAISADVRNVLQGAYALLDETRALMEDLALAASDAAGVAISQTSVAQRFRNATAVAMSRLSTSITEIDGQLTAQAEALTAVEATVGDATADGLLRISAQAGIGDVVSQMVAQVRATIGDDWIAGGYVIEAGFFGGNPLLPYSRFIVNTDQFVVTDGLTEAYPLVFEGGVLKLQAANIGTVTAGTIQSPDGKFIITVADGKIEWFE